MLNFRENRIYVLAEESEYIKWSCTKDNKTLCPEILQNWKELKDILNNEGDDNVVKKMLIFEKVTIETKKETDVKRLRAVPVHANILYVVEFVEEFLSKIINHRNLLRNYRTNIETVLPNIDDLIELWVDFSEKLTLLIKEEIQLLHWSKEQVTVHSGITKQNCVKKYHRYFSDDKNHDQCFVYNVLQEMLCEVNIVDNTTIVILSDNCTSQYKSAQNFYDFEL